MTAYKKILFAAMLTAVVLTCEKVPEFCGTGELYNPDCAFCYGSQPYIFCENDRREYNPLVQGCDADGHVGTRCADGSVVTMNTPCGGYMATVAVLPKNVDGIGVDWESGNKTNFTAGDPLTLTPYSNNPDYEFAGWGGEAASRTDKRLTYKFEGSRPQVTIVAMFKPKGEDGEYTLSASSYPEEGGYILRTRDPDPTTKKYIHGDKVRLTAVGNPGYVFDGWSGSVTKPKDQPVIDIEMVNTTALVALFVPTVRTLRANVEPTDAGAVYINSGSVLGGESREVGTEVVVWARAWEGYAFSHWTAESGARFEDYKAENATATLLSANGEVTAHFVPNDKNMTPTPPQPTITYKLTTAAQPAEGGTVSRTPNVANYNAGAQVTVTAEPAEGYRFTGWSGASQEKNSSVTITMDGDKTLTATFEWNTSDKTYYELTVSADPPEGGTVSRSPNNANYEAGKEVTVTATPNENFAFKGWSGASTSTNPAVKVIMNDNKTLTANFELKQPTTQTYTLTVNRNPTAGGTVKVGNADYSAPTTVKAGESITVTATPASGYMFDKWIATGVSFDNAPNQTITFTMPNNAVTLTANFVNRLANSCTTAAACKKITIGGVRWMAENLNIPTANSWCYGQGGYDYASGRRLTDDEVQANCDKYGRLYTWTAAMAGSSSSNTTPSRAQGVCPSGWHLPSRAEWDNLMTAVGGSTTAGSKLKSKTGWNSYSGISNTDQYEFSALPGGYRSTESYFDHVGTNGGWWTATAVSNDDKAYSYGIMYNENSATAHNDGKGYGFSVRCVEGAPLVSYAVTVIAGADATGAGDYDAGKTVNIYAGTMTGHRFKNWTVSSGGVTLANANSINTSFTMPANPVTVSANWETMYTVTVSGGTGATGSGTYAFGETVGIYAGISPTGQKFKNWTSSSGSVTFADANSAATTFIVQGSATTITVTAVFEATLYTVTVSGGIGAMGAGDYAVGTTVSINAGAAPTGWQFKNWTTITSGVTFTDANSVATTFTMPSHAVVVTAEFETETPVVTPPGGGDTSFVDGRDGKTYKKVTIGGKTWMAENLNIETVDSRCYDDSPANCAKYGRLYTWDAAGTACPSGWHLPSNQEWITLADYVGYPAGKILKSKTGWNNNGNGTDDYGFSALPGGSSLAFAYYVPGACGFWWTATEIDGSYAYNQYMCYDTDLLTNYNPDDGKSVMKSVRCVADD